MPIRRSPVISAFLITGLPTATFRMFIFTPIAAFAFMLLFDALAE